MGNKVGVLWKISSCAQSDYGFGSKYVRKNDRKSKSCDGSIECEVHIFNHPPSMSNSPTLSPFSWNNNTAPASSNHYQNHTSIFEHESDMLSQIGNILTHIDARNRPRTGNTLQDLHEKQGQNGNPVTSYVTQGDLLCVKFAFSPEEGSKDLFLGENESRLSLTLNEFCLLLEAHANDSNWIKVVNKQGERGWVPSGYLIPIQAVTESVNWYHGCLSKSGAEIILSSGVNGSFLVRESESSPGKVTLSMNYDVRIYHYRILMDQVGKYHINMDKAFNSIYDLVQYHTVNSDGLISQLMFPVPSQGAFTQSPIQNQQLLCSTYSWSFIRNNLAQSIAKHAMKGPDRNCKDTLLESENDAEKISSCTENSSEHRYENFSEAMQKYHQQSSSGSGKSSASMDFKVLISSSKIATL